MTRADNTDHLRRAAATRHDDAVARTRQAITEARRTGQPVTFATIARAAAVSRSWLYNQTDIRETIGRLRQDPPAAPTPAPQRNGPRPTHCTNGSTQPAPRSDGSAPTTPSYATSSSGPSERNASTAEPASTTCP